MTSPIRIGILGAARINNAALVAPAREVPEVEVAVIAARDPERAASAARKLGIPRVARTYSEILNDSAIDAVYIPLPNSLHASWAIAALDAGKHVLCEKPIASNADEAEQIARAAERAGKIVAEAMHSRYHRLAERIVEIVRSGVIGEVKHVEAHACFIIPNGKDIRWQYEMGGGALMDLGVYAVAVMRSLAGSEPIEVTSAVAKVAKPEVDRWVEAKFLFPNGVTGGIRTSLWGFPVLEGIAWAQGTEGLLRIINPFGPQLFNRLEIERGSSKTKEVVPRLPATYLSQLRAFVEAIRTGTPPKTGPAHFIANMRVIDAIYRKAGLMPRGHKLASG